MGDLSAYIKKKGDVRIHAAVFKSPNDSTPTDLSKSSKSTSSSDPLINHIAGPWGGLNEYVVRHFLLQLGIPYN